MLLSFVDECCPLIFVDVDRRYQINLQGWCLSKELSASIRSLQDHYSTSLLIKTLRTLYENQSQVVSVLKDQLQSQAEEIKNLQSEVLFIQNISKRKRQNDVSLANDDNME